MRGSNEHIIKTEATDGVWGDTGLPRPLFTSWCGEQNYSAVGMSRYPFGQRCPKCSAKFYASITPAGWTLEKIDPTTIADWKSDNNAYNLPNGLKSAYLAKHNDDAVAVVNIDNGWGEKWYIRALDSRVNDDETIRIVQSGQAQYTHYSRANDGTHLPPTTKIGDKVYTNTSYKSDAKRFNSKEAALFELADMVADGHAKPESVLRTEGAAKIIARRERAAQQVIDDQERAERRADREREAAEAAQRASDELDLIAMAFAEMVTEGKITNFQREAVFLAARRLDIKGLD